MTNLPANLPLEEAMDYYKKHPRTPLVPTFRRTEEPEINGFADFLMGVCPVRNSSTFWLIDGTGELWTAPSWHEEGEIAECHLAEKQNYTEWPVVNVRYPDYSPLMDLILERGPFWGTPGHVLVLAEFGEACVGLWDHIQYDDHRMVRALMIYAFDKEWGIGAFQRSVSAARLKHSRVRRRIRKKMAIGA